MSLNKTSEIHSITLGVSLIIVWHVVELSYQQPQSKHHLKSPSSKVSCLKQKEPLKTKT